MEDDIEQEQSQITSSSIPLFIKKLWKMVNDKEAENIISWGETGDSFIVHDQAEFITKLLPHYFKHNNMASFVRQLNFYNFHKVPNVKDEAQFYHTCFLKDVPEILPFIRRKNPIVKQKAVANYNEQEIETILADIKNLKGKHTLVDKELAMLKQENAALWNELNSLRLKYTKQSTIINMLIHFLITYIHSHQTAFSKPDIQVSRGETSRNNIKVGPPLLEIGYKNNKKLFNKNTDQYTVIEPGTSNSITYSMKLPDNNSTSKTQRMNPNSLKQMLVMEDQPYSRIKRLKKRPVTYSIKLPGSQTDQLKKLEIQRSLLEILKENDRLCQEEADESLAELDAVCETMTDLNDQDTVMEDVTNEASDDSTMYTISYPAEYVSEKDQNSDYPEYINYEDLVSNNESEVENLPTSVDSDTNIITKEIPIETKSEPIEYTISYPKNINSVGTNKKIKVLDYSTIPPGKKQKFIKIPRKNIKNIESVGTKTNLIKISSSQSPKQKSVKQNFAQNINSKSANPEGALLEILKENEKLTEDTPLQNLDISQTNNMNELLNKAAVDKNLEELYSNVVEEKPQGKTKINEKPFNILENPKENLSVYVDNTQEEIDMLQDILNNLTSNELSDILNVGPSTTEVDLDSEEIEQDDPTTDETMDEYNNTIESVDKYFKNNFLNLENA